MTIANRAVTVIRRSSTGSFWRSSLVSLGVLVLGRVLPLTGHPTLVVAGPSMEPTIPIGSAVVLDHGRRRRTSPSATSSACAAAPTGPSSRTGSSASPTATAALDRDQGRRQRDAGSIHHAGFGGPRAGRRRRSRSRATSLRCTPRRAASSSSSRSASSCSCSASCSSRGLGWRRPDGRPTAGPARRTGHRVRLRAGDRPGGRPRVARTRMRQRRWATEDPGRTQASAA